MTRNDTLSWQTTLLDVWCAEQRTNGDMRDLEFARRIVERLREIDERIEGHVRARFALFATIEPLDDKARWTLAARRSELQIIAREALGLPLAADAVDPVAGATTE